MCLVLLSELVTKLLDLGIVGSLYPIQFPLVLQSEGLQLAGVALVQIVLRLLHGCVILLLDILQGPKRLNKIVVGPIEIPRVLGVSIRQLLNFSV